MRATYLIYAATILAAALPTTAAQALEPGEPLGTVISRAINDAGPFFTPSEKAVIEAKCGYAPHEWDGRNFNISNGVFQCSNGKKVDDAQMRALLEVAQPRISAKVREAMATPEVQEAIRETAQEAARNALANLGHRYRHSD